MTPVREFHVLGHGGAIADAMRVTRAGSYVLEEELALGGFGAVYRARHEITGVPAAVKVLHAGWSRDEVALARFDREAEVVLSLAHPNVCEVFERGRVDDGRPYIAMELLAGSSLAAHLAARGRVPVDEVIAILEPLASALDAAHARGIVHRDVKLSNVFLADGRAKGRVVLLDFGVAKLCDAGAVVLTGAGDTVGTLLTMAPEQLMGSEVDARADVYAVGALAYVMLTGRPPFAGNASRVLLQIQKRARPAAPSSVAPIDAAFDAPILRALERDPGARFASAGELVASLRAASGAREPAPLPSGAIHRDAFAVYAEVRMASSGEDDDAWLADAESALPVVSSELSAEGLVAVVETSSKLLLAGFGERDPARARRAIDAAARAYRRFIASADPSGPVSLGIALHAGAILVSPEGTLLGGGLIDVASWLPAAPPGVIASRALLADLEGDDVAGAPGFTWIAR